MSFPAQLLPVGAHRWQVDDQGCDIHLKCFLRRTVGKMTFVPSGIKKQSAQVSEGLLVSLLNDTWCLRSKMRFRRPKL